MQWLNKLLLHPNKNHLNGILGNLKFIEKVYWTIYFTSKVTNTTYAIHFPLERQTKEPPEGGLPPYGVGSFNLNPQDLTGTV